MRDINLYLTDILKSIKLIESYTKQTTLSKFKREIWRQDAVVRRLEIIGEAMKAVPLDFKKKHKDIRWNDWAGIRDFLIHVYFGVNIDRLWKTLSDLEELKIKIKEIKLINKK